MLLMMQFFFALLVGWISLHGNEFGSSFLTAKETLIPELKDFAALNPNEHQEKKKIIGTINGALTLQTLAQAEKAKKLQAVSLGWWEKTAPVIEEIKTGGEQLYKAFRKQNLSELQVRRVLHGAGFKTFPKPKGIPSSSTVRISENGGGMVYAKADTTREETILICVMPGNPKSPNLMQRKPYVVQRRGKEAVAKGGSFVNPLTSEAHIPLEEFEFKGW